MERINELTIEAIELDKKLLDFKMTWLNDSVIEIEVFNEIVTTHTWLEKECMKNNLDKDFVIGEDTRKDINALMNDIAEWRANN